MLRLLGPLAACTLALPALAPAAARQPPTLPAALVPPAGLADPPPLATFAESLSVAPRPTPELALSPLSIESFLDPPVDARPWTRWWWLGGEVESSEIRRELEAFRRAGFGGVEIQAFSLGVGVDPRPGVRERVMSYDTPAFWQATRDALAAARGAGLGVDLNNGSGWPAGGPWVGLSDHYRTLLYGATRVAGGRLVEADLPIPAVPAGYVLTARMEGVFGGEVMSFPIEHRELLTLLAARLDQAPVSEGGTASSGTGTGAGSSVRLVPDSVRVLDGDAVRGDRLRWQAPDGDWLLIAVYTMPVGEAPTLTATARPGLVLDHFDPVAVSGHYDYLFGRRTGIADYWGAPLRGIFNDSLEPKVERLWADRFLEEFRSRRGYDLRPHLPVVFVGGVDNFFVSDVFGVHPPPDFVASPDDDARIRRDYDQTLSDLLIERFLEPSRSWANSRGLLSRAQAYGMAIDTVRAAGAIDIPETEALYAGGSDLFLKLTSSGAHLHGRPLVSAESFVWRSRDYQSTPQKIRVAADKLFVAGVNHVVWHGTPYRVERAAGDGYGEEGWYPWSLPGVPFAFSSNFSEASPFWVDAEAINRYLARCQLLLRQGSPEADVLVYFPELRFPTGFGDLAEVAAAEDLIGGAFEGEPAAAPGMAGSGPASLPEPLPWLLAARRTLSALDRAGITWEWADAQSIERLQWRDGALWIERARYGGLMFLDTEAVPVPTIEAAAVLASGGAPVFAFGRPPARQPGFHVHERNDERVRAAQSRIEGAGSGAVAELDALVATLRRRLEKSSLVELAGEAGPIRHVARALDGAGRAGALVLLRNESAAPASLRFRLPRHGPPYRWLDAVSGDVEEANADDGWLQLELDGFDSVFLLAGVELPIRSGGRRWPARRGDGTEVARLSSGWALVVEGADVPGGRFEAELPALLDWREHPVLRSSASPGRYRARARLDTMVPGSRYLLDLGRVAGAAQVSVNAGRPVAVLVAPYVIDVTDDLRSGDNLVEITVRVPLLDRFVGYAEQGLATYARFRGRPRLPGGLVGPVRLLRVDPVAP